MPATAAVAVNGQRFQFEQQFVVAIASALVKLMPKHIRLGVHISHIRHANRASQQFAHLEVKQITFGMYGGVRGCVVAATFFVWL